MSNEKVIRVSVEELKGALTQTALKREIRNVILEKLEKECEVLAAQWIKDNREIIKKTVAEHMEKEVARAVRRLHVRF